MRRAALVLAAAASLMAAPAASAQDDPPCPPASGCVDLVYEIVQQLPSNDPTLTARVVALAQDSANQGIRTVQEQALSVFAVVDDLEGAAVDAVCQQVFESPGTCTD